VSEIGEADGADDMAEWIVPGAGMDSFFVGKEGKMDVNLHEIYGSIGPYKVGFPACVPIVSILCKCCKCTLESLNLSIQI
jgi:hypothetical protein